MNYSKYLVLCILATQLAFAQFPLETPADTSGGLSGFVSEPVVQTPPPAPAPVLVPEAPSPAPVPAGKTMFDVMRGHAYNPYGTLGAANNVYDLLLTPSDIYGQKFLYISPSDHLGFAAFDMLGGSVLLGLDNSEGVEINYLNGNGTYHGSLAALKLGYATSAFGAALDYSISKSWMSRSDTDVSGRITYPGDNIGLSFSMPMGFATLYANGRWLTYRTSYSADYDGDVYKLDYSTIDVNAGLTGDVWDAFLSFRRTGGSYTDKDDNKYVDNNTMTIVSANFNVGKAVLQNQTSRVIVGSNNAVGMIFLDKRGANEKSDNIIGMSIQPNILGEIILFDNWLGFTGASHVLDFYFGNGDRDNKSSSTSIMHDDGTAAFGGIRYQRANWAMEAQVSANPFEALGGTNIFANFGGFIYF